MAKPLKENKTTKSKSVYKPIVPAVEEAGRVLLCLGQSNQFRMNLTEICKRVGLHKSKAFSILNTLKELGFVDKDPQTKTYSLAIGLVFLARNVLDHLDYRSTIDPFLKELSAQTNGIALFVLLQGDQFYILAKQEGDQRIGLTVRIGHRFPFTYGVQGKAIVAFLPEEERERVLSLEELYFYGDPAQVNQAVLREELAECARTGYAADIGVIFPGISAIASPVFGIDGKVTGAIVLLGTFSESVIEEYGPKTTFIAREVSTKFGADIENLYHLKREET